MANYIYKQDIQSLDEAIKAASQKVIRVFLDGNGLLDIETSGNLDQSEKETIHTAIQSVPMEILLNE